MIDVSKLTGWQIENAVKAYRVGASVRSQEDSLRSAAVYLQLPIEPPTEAEIDYAFTESLSYGVTGVLKDFVNRRNAANFLKPDPRREIISRVLREPWTNEEDRITRILQNLDEVE